MQKRRLKYKTVLLILGIGILCLLYGKIFLADSLKNMIEKEIIYKNAWIISMTKEQITFFANGEEQHYKGEFTEELSSVAADITVKGKKVKKIAVKQEKIAAKILAIRDDSMELERYGSVPLEKEFKVYKTYDRIEEAEKSELYIGISMDFVIAEGKLCCAVIGQRLDVGNIRVLLKTSGYKDFLHEKVKISSDMAYTVCFGEQEETHGAGEEIEITMDSQYAVEDRVYIKPQENGKIKILSIERSLGNPAYAGILEIAKKDGQFYIINELPLEEYLCGVVPSEMPASYPLEALKAQAVCARSYAYEQILQQKYKEYGAHVDDSVSSQVYNNIEEQESTSLAVRETCGLTAYANEQVIKTYYFSTSCGYTGSGLVWGSEDSSLQSKYGGDSQNNVSTQDEAAFAAYIKGEDANAWEKNEAWFRWNVTLNAETVQSALSIGKIKNISVLKREQGGVITELSIEGEKSTKVLTSEYEIRSILSPKYAVIKRNTGSDVTKMELLPSAYITIEPVKEGDYIKELHIYGGGFGHGTGMSQNGAKIQAQNGKSFEEIIKFYFSDTSLKQIYES